MINLYLMDMTSAKSITGVDRYISCLINGLKNYNNICLHWINLLSDSNLLFHKIELIDHFIKITIPLPQKSDVIIREYYWADKYNEVIFSFICSCFDNKENIVLHTNTLNLIDLAECIKKHVGAKIITHMHCIPWKNLYNSFTPKFNILYEWYYLMNNEYNYSEFTTSPSEKRAYDNAFRIVSGTDCAKKFLNRIMGVSTDKVSIIPNGIEDLCDEVKFNYIDDVVDILFVGAVTPGKGVFYILDALRLIRKLGYKVLLHIAGFAYPKEINRIYSEYRDLDVNILGVIPFATLKYYYEHCHIGLIASLQEQSSYTAIEMSMFGLPIITTAVDGLDEMFTDRVNAMKVDVKYNPISGLNVNVVQMKDKIIELIEDENKRKMLSMGARKLYEERFTSERMVVQTVKLYSEIVSVHE